MREQDSGWGSVRGAEWSEWRSSVRSGSRRKEGVAVLWEIRLGCENRVGELGSGDHGGRCGFGEC